MKNPVVELSRQVVCGLSVVHLSAIGSARTAFPGCTTCSAVPGPRSVRPACASRPRLSLRNPASPSRRRDG